MNERPGKKAKRLRTRCYGANLFDGFAFKPYAPQTIEFCSFLGRIILGQDNRKANL
jgi:hypothetical protein